MRNDEAKNHTENHYPSSNTREEQYPAKNTKSNMRTETILDCTSRFATIFLVVACLTQTTKALPLKDTDNDSLLRIINFWRNREIREASMYDVKANEPESIFREEEDDTQLEHLERLRRYSDGTHMSLLSHYQDAKAAGNLRKMLRGSSPKTHDTVCLGDLIPYVESLKELQFALESCAY
ncbi:uncharacterized protein LOC120342681 [Styela clava]